MLREVSVNEDECIWPLNDTLYHDYQYVGS